LEFQPKHFRKHDEYAGNCGIPAKPEEAKQTGRNDVAQ
jgi:hypothetical protein